MQGRGPRSHTVNIEPGTTNMFSEIESMIYELLKHCHIINSTILLLLERICKGQTTTVYSFQFYILDLYQIARSWNRVYSWLLLLLQKSMLKGSLCFKFVIDYDIWLKAFKLVSFQGTIHIQGNFNLDKCFLPLLNLYNVILEWLDCYFWQIERPYKGSSFDTFASNLTTDKAEETFENKEK